MKYILSVLVCLFLSPAYAVDYCLEDAAVSSYKSQLESVIDRLPKDSDDQVSRILRSSCYKQVYSRSGFSFTIFKDPSDPEQNLGGEVSSHITNPNEIEKCWEDAKAELLIPQFSWAKFLLKSLATKFTWRIDDPDIGPAKYLNCDNRKISFFVSMSVMLHEIVHTMSSKKCLFNSFGSSDFCFNLDSDLPLRSLGKFENVPSDIAMFYEPVQHLYMEIADRPVLDLFNELNAYIVSAKTETEFLLSNPAKVISSEEYRSLINLPLFLFYAANYMEKLRIQEPLKAGQNFGVENENRAELLRLLTLGENTFQEFQAALENAGGQVHPAEIYFWKSYLQLKQSL
jgi:hypothetical protein